MQLSVLGYYKAAQLQVDITKHTSTNNLFYNLSTESKNFNHKRIANHWRHYVAVANRLALTLDATGRRPDTGTGTTLDKRTVLVW